jgi:hypothetical protein
MASLLKGNKFGTPGSFFNFERALGSDFAIFRDFLLAAAIAFSTLTRCLVVERDEDFPGLLMLIS